MAADLLAFFSQDNFGCLDFDDVTLLDKVQRGVVVASMDQLLGYFLNAIGYQHTLRPKDVALRRDLRAWGYSKLRKATRDNAHLDAILDTTANCVEHYYPSACHQSKLCTAATTGAAIVADDLIGTPGGLEQLHYFSQRYLRGLPQPEGLCVALADGIRDCDEFYGSKNPRGGSFEVMGWLAGLDACCEEARLAQELPSQFASNGSRDQRTEWSVERLPYYIRNLAGFPNVFIAPIFKPSRDVEVPLEFWISGMPDLSEFICLANDLLSFSKEVLALENFNYFSLITRARRQAGRISHFNSNNSLWTIRDTLYEACEQLLSCTGALDKLFVGFAESLSEQSKAADTQVGGKGLTEETSKISKVDGERLENARLAAKLWVEFKHGYIDFHINHFRYRLDSLRATFQGASAAEIGVAAPAA